MYAVKSVEKREILSGSETRRLPPKKMGIQ